MKNFTLKNLSYFAAILFLLVSISSCKKEETDTTVAYLRVVNASPTSATYNAYFNGTMLNTGALPYAGAVAYSAYSAGSYNINFTTASTAISLYTKTLTLNQNTSYSFYLINRANALDGLIIGDDLSTPSTDKAYIRFINLSPDAPALDLAKSAATTSLITSKAYKTASGFITVDAGTYALDAKDTALGTVKTSLASTTFVAGYHYDIICGGFLTPANDTEKPLNLLAILIK